MKKVHIDQVALATSTNSSLCAEKSPNAGDKLIDIRLPSVIVGRIAAIMHLGEAFVDFPGNASGNLVQARTLFPVTSKNAGDEVALTFEDGDPSMPIIVGVLQPHHAARRHREVTIDDETLVLTAKKEVVIQCGKASITLTSAGKVLIQGEYVLSRSSGVNKIRGGSIQLN